MCEIEKGKQIAKMQPSKGGRPYKYPYEAMDVGDSFTVPNKTASDISGSLNYANKKFAPRRFKAGLYDENGDRIKTDGYDINGEPIKMPGVRIVRIA